MSPEGNRWWNNAMDCTGSWSKQQDVRSPGSPKAMSIEAARKWMNAPDGIVRLRPEKLKKRR